MLASFAIARALAQLGATPDTYMQHYKDSFRQNVKIKRQDMLEDHRLGRVCLTSYCTGKFQDLINVT